MFAFGPANQCVGPHLRALKERNGFRTGKVAPCVVLDRGRRAAGSRESPKEGAWRAAQHGAVSRETVIEMVAGALARFGATVAVAVTGIAGPSGGTADKPVGTVWIGWKRRGGYAHAELFQFDGDREAVRRQTVAAALRGVQKILTS